MASLRAAVRARISNTDEKILRLQHERKITENQLKSYPYPVLTLPNEIVSEIFIHFLPAYPVCSPLMGLSSPNLLTQICGKWREIALATPQLWRAIAVSDIEFDTFERHIHTLESWLNRSGGCPLSIQMPLDYLYPHVEDILKAIIPHRARWEYVKLTVSLSHLIDIQGPMPLLRQLNIRVEYNGVKSPAIAFSEAPLLRAVSLNDFTYPPGFMPWSQLTSLTLLATTPTECGPVLEQTINLVHCELVICGWDLIYHDIKLGCLESLTLAEFDPADPIVDYLDTLILPALRRLQVPDKFLTSGPTISDPIVTLTSFISKSGCKLQEVLIAGERSIPKDAYRKAFPSIPKFSFDGTFDWNFNQEFKDEDLDDTSLATSDFRQDPS